MVEGDCQAQHRWHTVWTNEEGFTQYEMTPVTRPYLFFPRTDNRQPQGKMNLEELREDASTTQDGSEVVRSVRSACGWHAVASGEGPDDQQTLRGQEFYSSRQRDEYEDRSIDESMSIRQKTTDTEKFENGKERERGDHRSNSDQDKSHEARPKTPPRGPTTRSMARRPTPQTSRNSSAPLIAENEIANRPRDETTNNTQQPQIAAANENEIEKDNGKSKRDEKEERKHYRDRINKKEVEKRKRRNNEKGPEIIEEDRTPLTTINVIKRREAFNIIENHKITKYFEFIEDQNTNNRQRDFTFESDKSLRVLALNIRCSLRYQYIKLIDEMVWQNIDVSIISETGLGTNNFRDASIVRYAQKKQYRMISGPYLDNKNSHICIFIKETIKTVNENIHKEGRIITLDVNTDKDAISIMGVYQAQKTEKETNKAIRKIIKKWIEKNPQNCIIAGDFNEVASPQDHASQYYQKKWARGDLHKLLNKKGLADSMKKIGGEGPTHTHVQQMEKGKCFSRIDYIYISDNLTERLQKYQTNYNSHIKSDHFGIWIEMIGETQQEIQAEITERINVRTTDKKKWTNWRERTEKDFEKLQENISDTTEVDVDVAAFNKIILEASKKFLKMEEGEYASPYTLALRDDQELQALEAEERKERNKWHLNLNTDKKDLSKARSNVKERRKSIINALHEIEWKKLEQKIKDNPSHIYKLLKTVGKRATRTSERPHIVEIDGEISTNPETVKKTFHEAWEKIFAKKSEPKELPPWKNITQKEEEGHILKKFITMEEMEKKIAKLKKGKACGTDNIANELLQRTGRRGREILQKIMNKIATKGEIPEIWKNSTTTMLYKGKGPRTDPLAYRPITLVSCTYKIYSAIMTERLNKWIEDEHILNDNQFGFRRGKDTADAAARLFTCISNAKNTGKAIHLVFLDIAKAYDSVPHWALQQTLENYGMTKADVNIIMNMVTGNKTKLNTAYGLTYSMEIDEGVRQGDGISPTLYALFLNPLIEWLDQSTEGYKIGNHSTKIGAYADDMAIIAGSGKDFFILFYFVSSLL